MNPVVAMVGTPFHWIAVAAAAIILLAPQYIPVIARVLGRLFGMELKRRYGITLKSQPATSKKPVADTPIETRDMAPQRVIKAEPATQLNSPVEEPMMAVIVDTSPKRLFPVWPVVVLVLSATTVLLWYLLHAR